MKQADKNCIVCGVRGAPDVWNGLDTLRCQNCGLAWRSLFDISADYYAGLHVGEVDVGEEKAAARLRNAENRLASIKEFLPKGGICDIGCGDGSFLSALRDKGYRNCWGIEPSAHACESASGKKLDVVTGDVSDVPRFTRGKMLRAVTLFHVLEHMDDPLETLQILRDALPSGGILVIETPDANAAIQKVTGHKNILIYREHLFYWTERSLRTALEQKGFRILKISRRSFDWQNSPIKSSLVRLGFSSGSSRGVQTNSHVDTTKTKVRSKGNLLRWWIRTLLAHLIHLSGRDDYLLIVSERL